MQNSCPSCGAETFPGARFCRRCGAPVGGGVGAGTGDVSPHAATVPLAHEETRTTDGLAPDEERGAPQTSRVSIAEMERLLRAQDDAPATPRAAADPEATLVSNPSAATRPEFAPADYDEELTISVPRPARTGETGDFEATTDLEATQVADLEATVPSSYMPSRQATHDLPSGAPDAAEDEAEPVGAWPYANATDGGAAHGAAAAGAPVGANAPGVAASKNGSASSAATGASGVGGASGVAGASGARGARQRRAWPLVVAVCAAAIFLAGGAWLAYRVLRRPAVTEVPTQPSAPTPLTEDARQQFERKLADAEALLAAGDLQGAMARLREANELDPLNWRAHRRLGDLLFESGAVRAAIEEYRAATRNAPDDAEAWKRLAIMQEREGLDRDAVESYRRFIALAGGESAADPHDLLAYAGALLRAGYTDEARALFQRLASSPDQGVAADARRRLDELARAQPSPAPTPAAGAQPSPSPGGETASAQPPAAPPSAAQPTPPPPAATPTPAPPPSAGSPAERYGRGVQLWSSNRGAALQEFRAAASAGHLDAHYYLGLAYVEGRSTGSLKRAEVVAALQHFQLAQRGGQHASQARGYAQQLEKEFDRLRRQ